MALTLTANPQRITPAYNEIKYIYSSTNHLEPGYKMIFDIYNTGSVDKIAEYRVLPNTNSFGEIDLSRLLQSYVSFSLETSNTSHFDAQNSYFKYDVNIGEEFIVTRPYSNTLIQNGAYVSIALTHTFTVGTQVVVTQADGGVANPNLEGLFTVIEQVGAIITLNSLWSEVTDITIDGDIAYADNRKTITRDIATVSNQVVFNGAVPFAEFPTYDSAKFILDDNQDRLLTTMPYPFRITLEQDLWVNFLTDGVDTGFVYFENSTGDVFKKIVGASGEIISMASVGAHNHGALTLVSGTGNLIEDDVNYYDFWYTDLLGVQNSLKYRIDLDRRCKINDYEIAFTDRMGSVASFAFQLKDKLTGKVEKTVYNQHVEGRVSNDEWTYDVESRGNKVINPQVSETLELNTNWMPEADATYFTELVSSANTMIKIDGVYFACIVEDSGYEKERQRNKNLIRKTIKVKLAVQNVVNG